MSGARVLLQGITVSLGGRRVLEEIDLDVAPGRTTVVLGASGAGKSTLLRAVAGLCAPDAGIVSIGDRVVADPAERVPPERRGVGMVFQSLELFPHLDVAENVAFGLPGRPRGERAANEPRVREVLEAVGLPAGLRTRRSADLSGGERQRVAIARALAPRPHVLLYDEPLASVDPSRRAELRALVRSLIRTRETTGIYVTHDAAEALELGDEIVVIDGGRIVDRGIPESVRAAPRSLASARAFGPVAAISAESPAARGLLGVASSVDPSAWILLRPEHVALADGSAGVAATVVDAYPSGDRFLFEARIEGLDSKLLGHSPTRLAPGGAVRLRVVGVPPVLASVAARRDA